MVPDGIDPAMFDVINGILQTIGVVFGTVFGFHRVAQKFEARLADRLDALRVETAAAFQNKVDVWVYSTKVKELHDVNNAQSERIVALETEVRLLRERT